MTHAARDVLAERQRQIEVEGWTPEGDAAYRDGELADAAACYARPRYRMGETCPPEWPWAGKWWKPTDRRRNLVKAGALILAEIERLDRAVDTMAEEAVTIAMTSEQARDLAAGIVAAAGPIGRQAMSDEMCPCQNRRPTPDAVARLVEAARAEADKAMRKYPQPNYVISKVAEEAGEVVKAAIHCAEGRETPEAVIGEIKQAMAMLIRLYIEGDQVHGLPPLAAMEDSHDRT